MSWDSAGAVFNYSDQVFPDPLKWRGKKLRILVVIIFKLLWKCMSQKACGVLKQGKKHPYSSLNTEMRSSLIALNACIKCVTSQLQLGNSVSHPRKN